MHRYLFGLFLFITTALPQAFAQNSVVSNQMNDHFDRAPSIAALEREAVKKRGEGDYYAAMRYFGHILSADSAHVAALQGYGESAMLYSAFEHAERVFKILVDKRLGDNGALLRLAEAQFRQGKYVESEETYRRFLFTEKPAGATSQQLEDAQTGLENALWAAGVADNTDLEKPVAPILEINSEYSEFSPILVNDTLYFSSYRFPFENDRHNPDRQLIKVMTGVVDADTLKTNVAEFNEKNRHTAHTAFNREGTVMYYTICQFVNSADIRCDLYMRQRTGPNQWGAAIKLPDPVNKEGYTTTEPAVGYNPDDDQEVLYFVSDRPGGKGKRDIWYTNLNRYGFPEPINLGALNTEGDDVTPFYHTPSATLYYSTNGLQTVGGFDVYKAKGFGDTWKEPYHMGMPINSGGNDVYFSLTTNEKTGFFASNRKGAINLSEEACCFDIFKADLVKPQMIAVTFNKLTGDSLHTTTLTLIELRPDGTPDQVKVKVPGAYFPFALTPGKQYILIGAKPGFKSDTLRFETPRTIWKDLLVKKLYLTPNKIDLIATVFDKDTRQPINGAIVRFVDLGPVEVRTTPKSREDSHVADNQYNYDLQFNHRYKVYVSKAGYTIDSAEVNTEGLMESMTIRRELYIRRGVDFLAHAIDAINKDTLYGVKFRLVEIEGERYKDEFVNPLGTKYYATFLPFERRYWIIASKQDYTTDSLQVSTRDLEKIPFQTLRRELQLRPLKLEDYLPIVLYFDNDEPDKRTLATTTDREYRAIYVDYIRRKQDFIDKFTAGMIGAEIPRERDSLDVFFERDVRGGWNRLMAFSEVLYEMMERGDRIEITLKGYASPRAATNYNLNLTSRRVSSVLNHFLIFDGGIYKKFVENGQITIVREPNGETKSAKGVSDEISDERKSIYSVPASKERRLEIIGVRVNEVKKL
jgi:hypothetical protein